MSRPRKRSRRPPGGRRAVPSRERRPSPWRRVGWAAAAVALVLVVVVALSVAGEQDREPVLRDAAAVAAGAELYAANCASCHGREGKGKGPMAQTLKVKPPDLTKLSKRNGGTFPFWQGEAFEKCKGG